MKLLEKLFFSFSMAIILFAISIIQYETQCLGEIKKGYGHYFVWLERGYTSLSYQIDSVKFILDFLLFFIMVFCFTYFVKKQVYVKWFKILIYALTLIIILLIIPYLSIAEVYFEKNDCEVIYSSFDFYWI